MNIREAQELKALWALLRECLPAKLAEMYRGGVPLLDQVAFHENVTAVEQFVDIIDYGSDQGTVQFKEIHDRISELDSVIKSFTPIEPS